MKHRYITALLAAFAILTLTACSQSTSGNPAPGKYANENPLSPTSSESKVPSVPSIDNPLEASQLEADPCVALPPPQLDRLGLKPGTRESASFGPLCEYEYTDVVGNQVSVAITKKFKRGLADVYARKKALGYFEPTTVAGFPGVYVSKDEAPSKGVCQLYVGLNSGLAPVVIAQLSGGTDYGRPCQVADMTAEAMIENLKG